jgi:uncharacterized membrane protein YhhN
MTLAIAIAFTALCVLALGGLLLAECSGREDLRHRTKPLASAAFLAVAIACGSLRGGPPAWVTAGLVLGAAGDVLLMYPGDRPFLAGLVAFLGGHVAYVIAFADEIPMRWWPHAPLTLVVPPIVAAAIALAWLWRHLGSMRIPVVAYVAVITTMGRARRAARSPPRGGGRALVLRVGPVGRARSVRRARLRQPGVGAAGVLRGAAAVRVERPVTATTSSGRDGGGAPCCARCRACAPRPSWPSCGGP